MSPETNHNDDDEEEEPIEQGDQEESGTEVEKEADLFSTENLSPEDRLKREEVFAEIRSILEPAMIKLAEMYDDLKELEEKGVTDLNPEEEN